MLHKTWPHWLLAGFGLIPAIHEAMAQYHGECGCWGLCPDTLSNLAWFVVVFIALAGSALYAGLRAFRETRRASVLLAFALPIAAMLACACVVLSVDFGGKTRIPSRCTAMGRSHVVAHLQASLHGAQVGGLHVCITGAAPGAAATALPSTASG